MLRNWSGACAGISSRRTTLADGRDVRAGERQMGVLVPGGGLQRCDDRLPSQHFRSFWCAWRTVGGYEAIHMIRKGQAYGSAAGVKVGLVHRFILGLFAATS